MNIEHGEGLAAEHESTTRLVFHLEPMSASSPQLARNRAFQRCSGMKLVELLLDRSEVSLDAAQGDFCVLGRGPGGHG